KAELLGDRCDRETIGDQQADRAIAAQRVLDRLEGQTSLRESAREGGTRDVEPLCHGHEVRAGKWPIAGEDLANLVLERGAWWRIEHLTQRRAHVAVGIV